MAYQTAAGPRDTNGPSCVLRPFYHFLLHILIYILSNIFSYAYSPIFSVRFFALCVLCVSYMYVCTVHPVCSDHSIIFFCIFLSIYYPIYSHMHILQYFLFGFLHFACCVYHTCMCALCILCAQTILSLSFEAMHHI